MPAEADPDTRTVDARPTVRTFFTIGAGLASTKRAATSLSPSENPYFVSRSVRALAPKRSSNPRMTAMSDPAKRNMACQSSPPAKSRAPAN